MKHLLSLCLLLVFASLSFGDDDPKAKPNTLTPKEIADGWILLFDGESTFGWKALDESKWSVVDGMLAPQGDKPALLVSTTPFADYDLSLQYLGKKDTKISVFVGCDAEGHIGEAVKNGPQSTREIPLPFPSLENWLTLTAEVREGAVKRYQVAGSAGFGTAFQVPRTENKAASGYLALSGSKFIVRNIKLKPVNTKSLFNDKDLDNWKVFSGTTPKVKSEFTVKDGTISLKNGPGDLQTKDAWADFVLQVECISNGKELNSGVFFRCRPDEYQMGYEAQIHNGWTEKPEKEYTIEEYDPKTNELKEKPKIKSTAKDYGTGAIYRRMPARREVAKDNEWFTMTIVAQGRHIATWVNGIQAVDWTDNRPLKDNARNGCRLEKGPISLQGHDPTTDLNFRNIRIAELPPLVKVEKK
jgi:hypothetical protein